MHLLSPCSRIVCHGNNIRWGTGLRSCTNVITSALYLTEVGVTCITTYNQRYISQKMEM